MIRGEVPIALEMEKCLIFGGNGFIGIETVKQLLEHPACKGCSVTLVNRGKSWDWKKKSLLPHVPGCIKCDRKQPLTQCQELVGLVNATDHFAVVVDFSGYDPFSLTEAVQLLDGKVGLYIYISSDSVYEVCDFVSNNIPTKETDAIRPSSKHLRKMLKHHDKYGHKKLKCEELLRHQMKKGGFPFVALRLADVIGCRDSTDRWLQYQLWLKLADALNIPVLVHEQLKNKPISLVYSSDVATLIVELMVNRRSDIVIHGESFNLAFNDAVGLTLESLLQLMTQTMRLKHVRIEHKDSHDIPQIYPSVEKGPIDVTKAVAVLSWNPTSIEDATSDIVLFHERALQSKDFTEEIWDAAKALMKDMKRFHDRTTLALIESKLKELIM